MSIILTQGPPYREPIHENKSYLVNITACGAFAIYLLFAKYDSYYGTLMQLTYMPRNFKIYLLLWGLLGFAAHSIFPKRFNSRFKKQQSSKRYKRLLHREKFMSV